MVFLYHVNDCSCKEPIGLEGINHEFKQCVQGNNLQTNCFIHAKVETQSNQCLWSTLFNVHLSKMKRSSWFLLFVGQSLDSYEVETSIRWIDITG